MSIDNLRFSGQNTMQVTLPSTLENGTYKVSPVFRVGNGKWIDVSPYQSGMTTFMTMVVSGSQITFNPPVAGKLSSSVKEISPLYVGGNYKLTFTVSNTGGTEYFGPLYPAFVSGTQASLSDPYMVDLMPGETAEVEYVGTVPSYIKTAGNYTFYMCVSGGQGVVPVSGGKAVTVQAAPETTVSYDLFSVVGNINSVNKNDVKFSVLVNVKTGYFDDQISAKIVANGTTTVLHTISAPIEFLNAGDRRTVTFSGEFPMGEVGKTYQAYLFVGNQQQQTVFPVTFKIGESSGIADVEAAAEGPVEYFNLQGMPVDPDNLRRGQIYIRRQGGTVAKILY